MDVLQPRPSERAGSIGALASLPVFFDLASKQVLVAGGSEGAAWKAELLAACGAEVHLFCPAAELSEEAQALPATIIRHDRRWFETDFGHFAMVVGDCDPQEAPLFFARATAAGVPVNVIDKPAFCQFKFGSIVNRSPLVVGISTDGAAPILGQAVRRRIETLLPPSLSSWARLAQSVRNSVMTLLPSAARRRRFWERLVERAFEAREPDDRAMADLLGDIERIRSRRADNSGSVTLVGAGPGDAELLTLKAVRALQSADVILFDDLVSDDVLELARREAKRMLVGKRGGRTSCRQEDINDMMLSLAKAGKRVVRLKSGDPSIFGRAGEEIEFLEQAGISVDVVPGITAASAMAARLGVSLTHRDHAQTVRFVTGHARDGRLPSGIDWQSLADPGITTVFYMGGRTAPEIRLKLLDAGMAANTPVVVMSAITRTNERRWLGVLDRLDVAMGGIGVDEPVLIGIGAVFSSIVQSDSVDRTSHVNDRVSVLRQAIC